jgi:CrcB protein
LHDGANRQRARETSNANDEGMSGEVDRFGQLDRDQEGGAMDEGDALPIDPDLSPSDPAEPAVAPRSPVPHRWSSRAQPDVLAVISVGGMLGASARYGIARWIPTPTNVFPWATFWTNLSGSFLLGFLLVLLLERFPPSRLLRPFLATGIIGAFTTMSTFEVETALLVKDGHATTGLLYGLGSLIAGLAVAYAGILAGRLTPARRREAH